ncbi:Galactose oxidase/kelch repeat superfamily protein isoform 1 [Hibiscus syriacus]|uniref:1-phosphatidylinositol-4-phosphate 5-kinase n=1 Tax=Hibiscus syriacus TaxID=106335 RepID=A0A6A3AGG7_HIBSY|nr:Galactose oxidase/kelch repeat superfamily protein isoform 1 [Hibiscus syriacus]
MAFSDDELYAADLLNAQNNWIQWSSRKNCNNLPPGAVTGFEWKDYCPKAFRLIQELDNIDNDDYMVLVCSEETIRKVTSTSRPGNMFLFSNDTRFAIKTLKKSEVKILLEMLPGYYSHHKRFRNTVLNKLYGVHAVTPFGGTKAYFVVVANIFKQIQHDCAFLEATGIMDYSLMLGLHVKGSPKGCVNSRCSSNGMIVFNVELHQSDLASHRPSLASYQDSTNKCSTTGIMGIVSGDSCPNCDASELSFDGQWLENKSDTRKFGEELSARGVRILKDGSGSALPCQNFTVIECYDVLLCFGIVDFFQNYSVIKRIEHAYKSLQFDRRMIAAVHPKAYSSRFQEFISDIFKADESLT